MFRAIFAVVVLAPAIGFCQSMDVRHPPEWWVSRAGDELRQVDRDSDQYRELHDLILATKSFHKQADWNSALDGIARLPDEKANFHLDIFADFALQYAQIGALEPAREALDRARDSPVARAPSCRDLILAAKLRIDAQAGDFDAALKDIAQNSAKNWPDQYGWLLDQAMAAHKPDIATRCLALCIKTPPVFWETIDPAAVRSINFYHFKVQPGQTALARWRAESESGSARAIAYAILAGRELHRGDVRHSEDIQIAVRSAFRTPYNIDTLVIVANLFAIEGDREGSRACVDKMTNTSIIIWHERNYYDYFYYLGLLQVQAQDLDGAEATARKSVIGGRDHLMSKIARHRLEAGDVQGAMRVLTEVDDSNLCYEVGRESATSGQLELLQGWIDKRLELPGLGVSASTISACCGAAAALWHQPATRPQ